MNKTPAVLKYVGAKHRIAPWITAHLPESRVYIEPFMGSAAVYLNLRWRPKVAVLNDLDNDVVNLFRVMREQPETLAEAVELTPYAREEYIASQSPDGDDLERARQFLVRCWMAHGAYIAKKTGWRNSGGLYDGSVCKVWTKLPERIFAIAHKLKRAEIEQRPALEVINRFSQPGVLLYVDPPYPYSCRASPIDLYRNEMTDDDHRELLAALEAHPGPVALSTYRNTLYDQLLGDNWDCHTFDTYGEKARKTTELLYIKSEE